MTPLVKINGNSVTQSVLTSEFVKPSGPAFGVSGGPLLVGSKGAFNSSTYAQSVLGRSVTQIVNGLPLAKSSAPLHVMRDEVSSQNIWERITAKSVMENIDQPGPYSNLPRQIANTDVSGRSTTNPALPLVAVGTPNYNEFSGLTAVARVGKQLVGDFFKTVDGVVDFHSRNLAAGLLNSVGVLPQPGQLDLRTVRGSDGVLRAAPIHSENTKFAAESGQALARVVNDVVTDPVGSVAKFWDHLKAQEHLASELFARGYPEQATETALYAAMDGLTVAGWVAAPTYVVTRGRRVATSEVTPQAAVMPRTARVRVDLTDRVTRIPEKGTDEYGEVRFEYWPQEDHGISGVVSAHGALTSVIKAAGDKATLGGGRDMFTALIRAAEQSGTLIRSVANRWAVGSDNHAAFERLKATGLSDEQAAAQTPSGRILADLGFSKMSVRPVDDIFGNTYIVTMEKEEAPRERGHQD